MRKFLNHFNYKRLIVTLLSASALSIGLVAGIAEPAFAYTVTQEGCHKQYTFFGTQVCVIVKEGTIINARRYVDTVEVQVPATNAINKYTLQTWGNGFYRSATSTGSVTWNINKYVNLNSAICGEESVLIGGSSTACINVH